MLPAATTKQSAPENWLYLFIGLHILIWTVVPYVTRYTLPMDAMEGASWGQHLQWGYDKNPFLNGWLTALAIRLADHADWGIYLFSQLAVGICFWATYQLGKQMLPPISALCAVLILEGAQYYNFHAIDFDDNTLELGLWALTILYFYQALRRQRWRDWLATGWCAGLGMMTKYYTAMLLLAMLLLLMTNRQARQSLRQPAFYASCLLFVAMLLPHIIWLGSHEFITIKYALNRINNTKGVDQHLPYATSFAWEQLAVFIPSLILAFSLQLTGNFKRLPVSLTALDWQFLLLMGVGPYLMTVLLSAVTGIQLRAGWGEPLLSLWGIILFAAIKPAITRAGLYRLLIIVACLLGIAPAIYHYNLSHSTALSSANYPGKIMAAVLTREWHQQQHTPLAYVVGARWLAGNIAYYSTDRPQVYIDGDLNINPWINEKDLLRRGGLFVWNANAPGAATPAAIRARFMLLGAVKVWQFSWLRQPKAPLITLNVALLAPQPSG